MLTIGCIVFIPQANQNLNYGGEIHQVSRHTWSVWKCGQNLSFYQGDCIKIRHDKHTFYLVFYKPFGSCPLRVIFDENEQKAPYSINCFFRQVLYQPLVNRNTEKE